LGLVWLLACGPLAAAEREPAATAVPVATAAPAAPAAAAGTADTADSAPVAPLPPGCSLLWQITPQLDTEPRGLLLQMRFDGGNRSSTSLRLPAGWDHVQEPAGAPPRLAAVPGDSRLRQLRHAPGEPVQLQLRLASGRSADGAGPLLSAQWFAFSGDSTLPWPDELAAEPQQPACITLQAPGPGAALVSSLGHGHGDQARWTLRTSMAELHRALFAGGELLLGQRNADGQPLTVAMPANAGFGFDTQALANATQASLHSLRQLWGPADASPQLLLLLPGELAPGGVALHQAVVLQAPATLAVPSLAFDELLGSQWLRTWLPERLGPIAHLGRGDSALRAWFTDGFADFMLHRWLLRDGRWRAEDYAEVVNRKLARHLALPERDADNLRVASGRAGPDALALLPAARGEWLALRWHQALRQAGQPGLEHLLRGLVVPAAQAHREGPLSTPLATHRLLAGLRKPLGDEPLRELTQHIDQGSRFGFDGDSLGPCFEALSGQAAPAWRARDQALTHADCQGWLNDSPGGERGGRAALAAAGAAAATAATGGVADAGRRVCTTTKPAKGAKGAKAKPRTVCTSVTSPQRSANGARKPAAKPKAKSTPKTSSKAKR
jgi:hypothetical protein